MLNIKNEVLVRVYAVAAVVLLVAFSIFLQLFRLSVTEAPRWEAKADLDTPRLLAFVIIVLFE